MWRKGANGAGKRLRIPAGRGSGTAAGGVRYPGDSANRGHDEDGGGSAQTVWRSGRSNWYTIMLMQKIGTSDSGQRLSLYDTFRPSAQGSGSSTRRAGRLIAVEIRGLTLRQFESGGIVRRRSVIWGWDRL